MSDADRVESLVGQLQDALGLAIQCGAVTLNINEGRVQSVETREHRRLVKNSLDRRVEPRKT